MPIHTTLPQELAEVDIIIIGGGTSGCVVASRLADHDRTLSILVIESGSNNLDVPTITNPALYKANLAPDSSTSTWYLGQSESQLVGRSIPISVGNCLGGSSSVNGMIYARPQAVDFDSWQTKGWSSNDLLPSLEKFEKYHSTGIQERHGSDGPINISSGSYRGTDIETDFINAMKHLGYPEVLDLQDLHVGNGVSPALRYVSPENGQRQDSAHRYLHPRIQQETFPNLHVLVGTQVARLLVNEGRKVEGVEYRPSLQVSGTSTTPNSAESIKARRFVIVSAGAFGTPLLLERSGIGNRDVLEKAGVPLRHHLPGVGSHYQDHQCCLFTYNSTSHPADTFESIYNGTRSIPALLASRDPILSWNGVDASAKIRPDESEIKSFNPVLGQAWKTDYEVIPSKPLASMILINGILADPAAFPKGEYFTICSYVPYPYSRGHVHITGPEIGQALDFKTGFLTDQDNVDLEIHIWAYKKQREIARRMKTMRSEIPDQHPPFREGSKASCNPSGSPHTTVQDDIEYSDEDHEAIKHFIRGKVATTWHPLGTCRMTPLKEDGVVDERLNVHGIEGLKIADMSIVPRNVSGNTMSTALLVGERAAVIFAEDLGLISRES
ncbi:putative glucose dehydrogenase [Xylaria flabelliformis]|nr:putative glucose dehydrogenase [Xylaria flabelliformis]